MAMMARTTALLAALVAAAAPVCGGEVDGRRAAWQERFETEIRPALVAHCGDCHAGDEGLGFDLDRLFDGATAFEAGAAWDRVAQVVARGEMPPEGGERLPEGVAIRLADWAASRPRPDTCGVIATDETANWYRGEVNGRRLTRAEYDNAVSALTDMRLRPAAAFPADACGGEGFDTHGSTLYSSPILTEHLLAAAESVIEAALPASGEPTPGRDRILITDAEGPDAARAVIGTFATRAYRGEVSELELDQLLTLYRMGRAAGDDHLAAVKTPLKAVLLSPRFLFVDAAFEGEGGVARLTGPQMAERLALLIWSGLPDEPLAEAGRDGSIFEPAVLEWHVRRMLGDRRSAALAENFGLQWLGLTDLTHAARPDGELFPEYDAELAGAMGGEVVAQLAAVVNGGRPLTDLIAGDRVYVNERLAAHYGLDGVEGGGVREVPAGEGRGGLLTTAVVLTATSYPHRTTPVGRGKWVLETLLGERMPPPPEGVASLEDHDGETPASLRERLERHRTDPKCAACHARMDPLGFALEGFDAVGRRREGQDTAGTLPGGRAVDGADDLKRVLLDRRGDFYANLSRKLLGYSLGRGVNEFDECVVRRCTSRLEETGGRFDALVLEVVSSYPFQHRYYKK